MKTNLEKREVFTPGAMSLREGKDTPVIEGVAIVCEQETTLYEGSDWREIEVIDRAAINPDFIAQQDIKLNLLHDRDATIARTPTSLRCESREDGLHFEADVPDCDLGKRAQALIGNGTYTGCSFEFYPKDYQVSERTGADGKTEYVIRHTGFEKVTALTIAMDPAYKQTSVNARELYREQHPELNRETEAEEAERLAAEQAAKEQAEKEKAREQLYRDQEIARIRRETELLNFHINP